MAIEVYPELGVNVNITLTTGAVLYGYWDGTQWWVGLPEQPDDMPVVNSYVASWSA